MVRNLDRIKTVPVNKLQYMFEQLSAPHPSQMIHRGGLDDLDRLAKDTAKSKADRIKEARDIMEYFGFHLIGAGTNREIFINDNFPNAVMKVATNINSTKDAIREMRNQEIFRPFCSKCFWFSEEGAVGEFERIIPFKNKEHFDYYWDWIRDNILTPITAEYAVCDIGNSAIKNYGLRPGFGPVLCDYTFLYKIVDQRSLLCKKCGGLLMYDEGFNNIYCSKCGAIHHASDLGVDTIMVPFDNNGKPPFTRDSIINASAVEAGYCNENGTIEKKVYETNIVPEFISKGDIE